MTSKELFISFYTIVRKDFVRIMRIWPQTFLPSVVTSVLYFLIFGTFLGSRIGSVHGVSYMQFVVPGLVMLAVVTNSFTNVAMVMFQSKFFARNIDEILVSPTPPWIIIVGFMSTGVVRGVLIGLLVLMVSLFFAIPTIASVATVAVFLLLTSMVFSLLGLVNGIYAKSFDGITIIPTFVLTPLVYLGGVFYSATILPSVWQKLMYFNPIFYLINGFRRGLLGVSDVPLVTSVSVLLALAAVLGLMNLYLLRKGLGLKQ